MVPWVHKPKWDYKVAFKGKKLISGRYMKILLISDSHGKREWVNCLVEQELYDYVFFAGDGLRDLGVNTYDPKFVCVKGNCDFFEQDAPITQTLYLNGVKILVTHGDYFKVKYGLEILQKFAKEKQYNLVCFGHTHSKTDVEIDGIKYINAGSFKNGDYAEIEITDNGINVVQKNLKV